MKKDNIVLIGMPSSGKSTVGVVLAKALGMKFLDTDLVIQEREGELLQNIINFKGLDYFKKAEENAILSLNLSEKAIISTGGSAIYSEKAMEHLKQNGKVFYLKLSYNSIVERLNNLDTRGVAIEKGQSLKALYEERTPLYENFADVIVDCEGKRIFQVVNELIEARG